MRVTRLGLVSVGALAALLALGGSVAADESAGTRQQPLAPSTGMRVYIDPETGEFAEPPADQSETAPLLFQGTHPGEELVEEVNPAGGYTLNLKRRFGGIMRAEVGPNGVEAECEAGVQRGEK